MGRRRLSECCCGEVGVKYHILIRSGQGALMALNNAWTLRMFWHSMLKISDPPGHISFSNKFL